MEGGEKLEPHFITVIFVQKQKPVVITDRSIFSIPNSFRYEHHGWGINADVANIATNDSRRSRGKNIR